MSVHYSLFTVHCSLFFVLCSLFSVFRSLFSVIRYLLSAICDLLSAICYLLSAICYLLSAICCLLSAVCCLLSIYFYPVSATRILFSVLGSLFVGCLTSNILIKFYHRFIKLSTYLSVFLLQLTKCNCGKKNSFLLKLPQACISPTLAKNAVFFTLLDN